MGRLVADDVAQRRHRHRPLHRRVVVAAVLVVEGGVDVLGLINVHFLFFLLLFGDRRHFKKNCQKTFEAPAFFRNFSTFKLGEAIDIKIDLKSIFKRKFQAKLGQAHDQLHRAAEQRIFLLSREKGKIDQKKSRFCRNRTVRIMNHAFLAL